MIINIVINCQDVNIAKQRFALAQKFAGTDSMVHLDIADGSFTGGYKTWSDSAELKKIIRETKLRVALHLMVANPDAVLDEWLNSGISRIIVHFETITDPTFFVAQCKAQGVEPYLAISPKTDMGKALADAGHFDGMLVLAVTPGLSGQEFQEQALAQIQQIRNQLPELPVAVDGGITLQVAKRCKDAGATQIAVGAHIFNTPDSAAAYAEFVKAIAD